MYIWTSQVVATRLNCVPTQKRDNLRSKTQNSMTSDTKMRSITKKARSENYRSLWCKIRIENHTWGTWKVGLNFNKIIYSYKHLNRNWRQKKFILCKIVCLALFMYSGQWQLWGTFLSNAACRTPLVMRCLSWFIRMSLHSGWRTGRKQPPLQAVGPVCQTSKCCWFTQFRQKWYYKQEGYTT
jgi:hypothetical protein